MALATRTGRPLARIDTTAPAQPGFIGEGHTAVEVVHPNALAASDPFVLLADDRLDMPRRRQIGGAHPHAGLETVTFVLEGALHDRDEGAQQAGDVVWMTAGRGIIHNEAVEVEGRARFLQLWIALPAQDRDLAPRFQRVRKADAPIVRAPGAVARLYSGASGDVRSATRNRVPVTMLDLVLEPQAAFTQDLPRAYRGFVYVLEGRVRVGEALLSAAQVGWFAAGDAESIEFRAEAEGARLVLYAGQPIGEPLLQQGPFVAGSAAEIGEFFRRFRAGRFTPMSQLAADPSL